MTYHQIMDILNMKPWNHQGDAFDNILRYPSESQRSYHQEAASTCTVNSCLRKWEEQEVSHERKG